MTSETLRKTLIAGVAIAALSVVACGRSPEQNAADAANQANAEAQSAMAAANAQAASAMTQANSAMNAANSAALSAANAAATGAAPGNK
jgi:hypothetical protein